LTSLPVYALSFFKAPSGIIFSLDSIFTKKIWGGCEDHRKLSWVSWTTALFVLGGSMEGWGCGG